jgi:hypothetical protein
MNKERMLELAAEIEKLPHGHFKPYEENNVCNLAIAPEHSFNMTYYFDDCGSPCCIAGHAAAKYRAHIEAPWSNGAARDARIWLDLTEEQANILFVPRFNFLEDYGLPDVTPSQAAQAIRNMAEKPWADEEELWGHVTSEG